MDQSKRAAQCPFSQWREDFPIEWEDDHYVTRREMAKFLALGSAVLAGANGALAVAGALHQDRNLPEVKIGSATQIAPGGSILFNYPTERDPCILVRGEGGELRAYSQVCTHLSCAVIYREEEKTLFCPCHHGYFALDDGRPTAGPPIRRLPQIKVEQRGEDLFATGIEI